MTSFPLEIPLDELIDAVRSGLVVLDEGLRVKGANRSFYRLFQVDEDETVGRLIYDLGNRQWDIPALRELLERIIPQDEAIEGYEIDHVFEGIGRRIIMLNARTIRRDGEDSSSLLLAIDDVTAEREARQESERAWRLSQTIVDTVRDPLVILEGDMTVASTNRAFLALFGVNEAEVVGRRLKDLGQGQWDVSALGVLLSKVVPDEAAFDGFEIEDDFPRLGRRIFKLNARKVFRSGNHDTRLLVVLEDATEARLLERHRDILAAELAHRIKNSLQIISSFVSFEIRRAAEPCVEGYRAMQARIGAVAELYDVISRSAALGPVPVQPYLSGLAGSLQASLLGQTGDVDILVEADALLIDPDSAIAIGLIVNELTTNAIKHAFPSRGGRIFISFERRDGEVALIIRDDGVGHTQARKSGARSGLGSRYVEAFVKQLGGGMARATGSTGTTMTVKLPASILVDVME